MLFKLAMLLMAVMVSIAVMLLMVAMFFMATMVSMAAPCLAYAPPLNARVKIANSGQIRVQNSQCTQALSFSGITSG